MDKVEGGNHVEATVTASLQAVTEPGSENELKENSATPALPQAVKVKRDFYQTEADVVINFLAKNLKKDDVKIDFQTNKLIAEAKLADGTDYMDFIDLFHPIDPSACSYKVLSTKIEVRLRKLYASTWPSLEAASAPTGTLTFSNLRFVSQSRAAVVSALQPGYPTSSKKKLDWGKVEKEIEKEVPDEQDVNNLFAKIFASGDENTKRAMMKSMQESGGTVLSTNWEDVGKKKVACSPPDGMEWKSWDNSDAK